MQRLISSFIAALLILTVASGCGREKHSGVSGAIGSRSALSLSGSVPCTGYAERRIFLESQAWLEGQGKVEVHVGTCFPYKQTVSGKLSFRLRVTLAGDPGEAYQLRIMTQETILAEKEISFKCLSGVCTQWHTMEVDTTRVPFDGRQEFRFTAKVKQSNGDTLYQSTGFQAYLNNGRERRDYRATDMTIGRGFHSALDNINSDLESDIPLTAVSGVWSPKVELASGGSSHIAYVDGTLLRSGSGGFKGSLSIDTAKLAAGAHELILVSKRQGSVGTLAGVLIVPFEVSGALPPPPVPSPSPSASPKPSPTPSTSPAPSPTPSPSASPKPSPTLSPTPSPSASASPVPLPGPVSGIWIGTTELMSRPTSGTAWNKVLSDANSSWGSADLSNNDSVHDVKTLAGALVAARISDSAMRNKTIQGLQSAMISPLSRALELSRGLQTYCIAADLIGYRTAEFEAWVRKMLNANVQGHSGGTGVIGTALNSANNWGGHARASATACALYLKDQNLIQQMVDVHLEFIGAATANKTLSFTDTDWHAVPTNKAGVNRLGATRNGINIDGAIPEDMRRGGGLSGTPVPTGYGWEAMQGYVVNAILLHRAGKVNLSTGNGAVRRAYEYLYRIGWKAEDDDTWLPWLANHYLGMGLATEAAKSGKNMGFTDWTHPK